MESEKRTETTVHIFEYGCTLCRFGEGTFPGAWAPGHLWTYRWDRERVTCKECLDILTEQDSPETNP